MKTLEQWLSENPQAYHKSFRISRGDNWDLDVVTFGKACLHNATELWNLSDYVVSSRQGDSVHLLRKT